MVGNPSRREIWVRKLLYPAYRWPGLALAMAPVIVASGAALRDGVFAPVPAILAILLGGLMQLGGVLAGIHRNLLEEPADGEHPELVHAVQTGTLHLPAVKTAAWACFATVAAACICLFFVAGVGVFLFGFVGVVAAWAYSSGPLPLGKAGLADPLFFVLFGIVAVLGSYYVQAAPVFEPAYLWQLVYDAMPLRIAALGIPIGALATTLLINDDIRDREFDVLKGKRTITVRFGIFWGRLELAACLAVAYLSLLWLWAWQGWSGWVLLPFATLPFAYRAAKIVFIRQTYNELLPAKRHLARVMLAFATLMAIGLAVSWQLL